MVIMNNILILFILISNINLFSRFNDDHTNIFNRGELVYRDSIQIYSTIYQWQAQNFKGWSNREDLYIFNYNDVKYEVNKVLYSPDSLKLIVWIIKFTPNPIRRIKFEKENIVEKVFEEGIDTVYMVLPIICYRETRNSIWNIFNLELRKTGYCAINDDRCYKTIEEFYFNKLKDVTHTLEINQLDTNYGKIKNEELIDEYIETESIDITYGYNLDDNDFWEKCLIWKKGFVAEGRYIFEPVSEFHESIMPKIEYPDSIINLFNNY